jgi:hypothetical protein
MRPDEDWRKKPWRLLGICLLGGTLGATFGGDYLSEFLYWTGLLERPPWKQ